MQSAPIDSPAAREQLINEVARMRDAGRVSWYPQSGPQEVLIDCPIFEILMGGARGGGKTDAMLGDWAFHASQHGILAKGVFFRRRAKQLEDVVIRAKQIYISMGWRWVGGATSSFFSPNGAVLKFRHLWDDSAASAYQGHSYTRIYAEELTQWPDPSPLFKVMATLRSAHGIRVAFKSSANPGGAGHGWCKARYIDPAPFGYVPILDSESKQFRIFIPARLEDNPILTENDPQYENRLSLSGSTALVKAWRWGIWDIVAGGFFDDVWNPIKHILPGNIEIPKTWSYQRSFDWGSAKPSSLGVWAISNGSQQPVGAKQFFPRGSMIRIGEWYTCLKGGDGIYKPNVGMRLNNASLADGIVKSSGRRAFVGCVADPSIFTEQGGDSIYIQLRKKQNSIRFRKADNERIPGWQKLRDMLEEATLDRPENPGLWVMENCLNFIRTVPVLQRDEKKSDDIDTEAEDHIADETRYACMSRRRKASTQEVRY